VNCLGRGTIRAKRKQISSGDNFYYGSVECPECNGLGYSENKGGNREKDIISPSSNNR